MSGRTTPKRSSRTPRALREELRQEYRFDYAKARPNRFAAAFEGRTTAVVLDPDVAEVFRSPEAVNRLLRPVIAAFPGRSALPGRVKQRRQTG
jgi:hypothetical protein